MLSLMLQAIGWTGILASWPWARCEKMSSGDQAHPSKHIHHLHVWTYHSALTSDVQSISSHLGSHLSNFLDSSLMDQPTPCMLTSYLWKNSIQKFLASNPPLTLGPQYYKWCPWNAGSKVPSTTNPICLPFLMCYHAIWDHGPLGIPYSPSNTLCSPGCTLPLVSPT